MNISILIGKIHGDLGRVQKGIKKDGALEKHIATVALLYSRVLSDLRRRLQARMNLDTNLPVFPYA